MNKRVIVYVLGAVLLIEATLMLLPLLVAVIYREKRPGVVIHACNPSTLGG